MTRNLLQYIILVIVVVVSFVTAYKFEFYPKENTNNTIEFCRLLIPGILFSIYVALFQQRDLNIARQLLYFFILVAFYVCVVMTTFWSWGFAIPFTGGFGAQLISILFCGKQGWLSAKGKDYFLIGFITGVIGLIFFYISNRAEGEGLGIAVMIVLWQLSIGIKYCFNKDKIVVEMDK
jgi:hypothetical protein